MPRRASVNTSAASTLSAPTTTAPVVPSVPVEIIKTEAPLSQPRAPKEVILSPGEAPVKKVSKKKKAAVVPVEEAAVVVETPVVPTVVEELSPLVADADIVNENLDEDVVLEESSTENVKRTRRVVSKESLRQDWNLLWTEYAQELSAKKRPGQKLNLAKYLLKLQADAFKLLKIRPVGEEKKPRAENSNSGFMKPVHITPELAKFINVNSTEPITRVLITKKICEYIKEKDLQNPQDRREILPDVQLKKIFNLTENETEPLTYYSMQKKIQSHIFKA